MNQPEVKARLTAAGDAGGHAAHSVSQAVRWTPGNLVLFLGSLAISAVAMAVAIYVTVNYFQTVLTADFGTLHWLKTTVPIFSLRIDALSCLMLLVITMCGFLVVLYSGGYMSRGNVEHPSDEGLAFYYFLIVAFVGAMVGLVCSSNFFEVFIFWEITTFCSWGLISFYGDKKALQAGFKALVITYAAGLFLAAGVILLYVNTGSFAFAAINQLSPSMKTLVVLFFSIAAFGKAAQFPMFTWLPTAMSAPTPASAYLHAAAMVKAGVYLIARLVVTVDNFPPQIALLISVLTVITMCGAVVLYYVQEDMKRLLAFSTIANLAIMILGLSLGAMGSTLALKGGLLHLIGHSFTKTLLFFAVGAISYATGTRSIALLSGLGKKLPLTSLAFVVGAMAISGLPPFNMFWSKYYIVSGAIELHSGWGWAITVLMLAESVAGFACFLMVVQKVFFGQVSETTAAAGKVSPLMQITLILLIILSVVSPLFSLPIVDRIIGG